MDASDEVRVVEGYAWEDEEDGWVAASSAGKVAPDYDLPHALLVIDSGLTAEQMRAALSAGTRLAAVTRWLEQNRPEVFREGLWDAVAATDTGGNDGQG